MIWIILAVQTIVVTTGINLAQCSPPHMAETNALVTKPLV